MTINRWTHPWKYEVPLGDLLHDEATPFPALRDAIVARLRAAGLPDNEDGDLAWILDDMGQAPDADAFDQEMSRLYDYADDNDIWLDPFVRVDSDG